MAADQEEVAADHSRVTDQVDLHSSAEVDHSVLVDHMDLNLDTLNHSNHGEQTLPMDYPSDQDSDRKESMNDQTRNDRNNFLVKRMIDQWPVL